jgi:hypothetical protein
VSSVADSQVVSAAAHQLERSVDDVAGGPHVPTDILPP